MCLESISHGELIRVKIWILLGFTFYNFGHLFVCLADCVGHQFKLLDLLVQVFLHILFLVLFLLFLCLVFTGCRVIDRLFKLLLSCLVQPFISILSITMPV